MCHCNSSKMEIAQIKSFDLTLWKNLAFPMLQTLKVYYDNLGVKS